jgi:hypothetical protein
MSAWDPAVETASFSWDEGLARLEEPVPPAVAAARRRIIAAVEDELRRRLGATFSLADLARVYEGAASWYLDLASRVAPRAPEAWDPAITLDAAFGVHRRHATDARS